MFIALIFVLVSAFVLVFNAKYLYKVIAISNFAMAKTSFFDTAYKIKDFLPDAFVRFINQNLLYTKLNEKQFYSQLFHVVSAFLLLLFFSLLVYNLYYLLLAFFIVFVFIVDFLVTVAAGKKSFVDVLGHLVNCLEILTIKTEMPLNKALQEILESLDDKYFVAKQEINILLEKANDLGMQKVLSDINKEDLDEQEFFSILLAIYQGTKKTALQKNLSDFKLRQKNIADEKRKIFIENMQLYLLLPATVMLMVAMYPMIDMILFQLQGVF